MGSKVGHATDSVALNLNIRAEHLTDERLESVELDDKQLVFRYTDSLSDDQRHIRHCASAHH